MAWFDAVAAEYDAARPAYPSGVYDALGPLEGVRVIDAGAGTGIATRQLLARGAWVVALDHGIGVLSRAAAQSPGLPTIVGDGAVLPFADSSFDLICFAQAWHWLDEAARCAEAHRVLRGGGRWAAWWSHARADDEEWFDTYWSLIEATCRGTHRNQRDVDWGAGMAASGLFDVGSRMSVPWYRQIPVDDWLTDQVSHSYVAALPEPDRDRLLVELRAVLERQFPSGIMDVPYETWLWVGRKR